jgi:hypothetical protein
MIVIPSLVIRPMQRTTAAAAAAAGFYVFDFFF